MAETYMVIGGSASGKSTFAEQLARRLQSDFSYPVYYLATGSIEDDEFARRVKRHQERRPQDWQTIEEKHELAGAIRKCGLNNAIILVDGIGTWISNLLLLYGGFDCQPDDELNRKVMQDLEEVAAAMGNARGMVIMVADEVGMGVVPAYTSARTFRDINGQANQIIAAAADNVYWVAAGIPLCLKGRAEK